VRGKVPSEQSRADSSVANPAGKPGNGRLSWGRRGWRLCAEPRNGYGCGLGDKLPGNRRGKPMLFNERKAAVPNAIWRGFGTPPGSETRACVHGGGRAWQSDEGVRGRRFRRVVRGAAWLCAKRGRACLVTECSVPGNRMREILTSGSVGGASGNRRIYPEADGGGFSVEVVQQSPRRRWTWALCRL